MPDRTGPRPEDARARNGTQPPGDWDAMLDLDCIAPEAATARRPRAADHAPRRGTPTAEERAALAARRRLDRLDRAFLTPGSGGERPADAFRRAMEAVRAAFGLAPDTPEEAVFAYLETVEGGITNHVLIMEAHGVPALFHWGPPGRRRPD